MGWCAFFANDDGRDGFLRVGTGLDTALARRQHQTFSPAGVRTVYEVWLAGRELADRMRAAVLIAAANNGAHAGGPWVRLTVDELADIVTGAAESAGFRLISAADREREVEQRYAELMD